MTTQADNIQLNHDGSYYLVGGQCHHVRGVFNNLNSMLALLGEPMLDEDHKGKLETYSRYREVLKRFSSSAVSNQTFFDLKTPEKVRKALESARRAHQRVRIWYGDPETGRSYMDSWDVTGTIGRSMGTMKVPLLIANRRSYGGGAILDAIVVRIDDIDSRKPLYIHPEFHTPELEVRFQDGKGYCVVETLTGATHIVAKSAKQAENWIAFQKGERYRQ